ncbi:MAG: fumarate reductase subunit C [Gammaproteobacteria bacterium]|nr:fumarate reductase subunit C [Gammaproteobacteria bacterium]
MTEPRMYHPRLPLFWYLRRPSYVRYMLRELTCIGIGAYAITLAVGLLRLAQGPAAWQGFWQAFSSPAGVAFQVVALAFTLYHTVSWFQLAPSTMPIWRGETQVPPARIRLAHYLVFAVVSIAILLIVGF